MAGDTTGGITDSRDSSTALGLDLYRVMTLIRQFEETAQALYLRGEVHGSIHLCIGQEAVSAGVCGVLGDSDLVAATYRGHGHALALGVDPFGFLAELLGRAAGICGGRAGSMNVVDLEHRLIGCFGIVGGSMAAATGASLKLRKAGGVAVAFFGDGTANQAYFHECLNFAKVFELPVVYVCENNRYGEYTPFEQVTPGGILARPKALGIPSVQADGNDVWAVREAAASAVAAARSGKGPQFIEALTYRFNDHGRGDPVQYRPEGELERWKERDPLTIGRGHLLRDNGVSEAQLVEIETEIREALDEARAAALAAPFPVVRAVSQFKGGGGISRG